MSTSIIPISSELYQNLKGLAESSRLVFITGLPGVGKSLLIQQLGLIAAEAGREVHLLQWITARKAFETEENLARHPEVDGVTAPAIRKGVGLWAREAVARWDEGHPEAAPLLIGELPLIGNRLIELVEPKEDGAEALLRSEAAQFVVPVPSWEVRQVIETARAKTLAEPSHAQEKRDAAPNVLRALWQELNGVARDIRLTKANPSTPYNPYIYGGVYQALLGHRHSQSLLIDQVLHPARSVYELEVVKSELIATEAEVSRFMKEVESGYSPEALALAVEDWHSSISDDPRPVDPGLELRLPPPERLPGVAGKTDLSAGQRGALQKLLAVPLDATPSETILALDRALASLRPAGDAETVNAKLPKFDLFDGYFNVKRTDGEIGVTFLAGLLSAYRNVLEDLTTPPETLSVVEMPMLRIAMETAVRQFEL